MSDADPISIRASGPDDGSEQGLDAASAGGPKRRAPVRKRHTVAKVLTSTTIVMALIVGLSVSYFYRHLNSNINVSSFTSELSDRPEVVEVEGPKKPLNILVMGSDSRDCDGCKIDGEGAGGSDTTILLHVSANRKRAYGISIPRDSMINRPECKRKGNTYPAADYQQWNAAFGIAGPGCTIQQFEQLTGVRLQHHVVVNFASFKAIVDAIDGVEVCIPEDIDDDKAGIQFTAGTQKLNPQEALDYVRVRNTGDGSDLTRVKRQQAFIASMANKIQSAETLANPTKVVKLLNAVTQSLTVDEGLGSVSKLSELALQFQDTGLDKIQFFTIPFAADPQNPAARIVWAPEAAEVWKLIKEDKMIPGRLKAGLIRASNVPGGTSNETTTDPSSPASPNTPQLSPREQAEAEAEAAELRRSGLCA